MDRVQSFQSNDRFNLALALAQEVKQYMNINAENLDGDVWDNLGFWRSGILSQSMLNDDNLAELIDYIGVEKVQELVQAASNSTINEND